MASIDDIEPPLEAVEYLARSPNRVEVLDAIAETPRARHQLRELTGASRVTVSRILTDLEERGWVVHANGQYEPTPRGAFVASEFTQLLENMEAAEKLDGALGWLPTDAFEFDLACLHDAEVLRASSWKDHTASIRHAADLVDDATRIWGTAIGFSHEVVDAIRERTVGGEASFEAVVDGTVMDMICTDAGLRSGFRDVIESGNGSLHRYDGEKPPHMVMTFDETVVVCGHTGDGPPPGTLETDDETVRKWARSYYESALNDSRPVDSEHLTV